MHATFWGLFLFFAVLAVVLVALGVYREDAYKLTAGAIAAGFAFILKPSKHED